MSIEKKLAEAARGPNLARELVRLGLWEPELLEITIHHSSSCIGFKEKHCRPCIEYRPDDSMRMFHTKELFFVFDRYAEERLPKERLPKGLSRSYSLPMLGDPGIYEVEEFWEAFMTAAKFQLEDEKNVDREEAGESCKGTELS